MTSLVTGATGFIGARLVQALLTRGETVHIFCRSTSDVTGLEHERVRVFRGSLTSREDVEAAMRGCARVYHLAAFAGNWARDAAAARRQNLAGIQTMVHAARACGVQRMVYTSTIMTYGPSNGSAVTETTLRSDPALTLYEQCKLDAETVVDDAIAEGQDIVVLHPTRVFGPGKLTEANSTTIMIKQYLKGTWRSIPGAGDAMGNYVYVDDVVQASIAAMERAEAGRHFIVAGRNLTYGEFFELLARTSGVRRYLLSIPKPVAKIFAHLELLQGRLGLRTPAITPAWVDIFYDDWACSAARASAEIGYAATPIERAFEETIAWLAGKTTQEVPS